MAAETLVYPKFRAVDNVASPSGPSGRGLKPPMAEVERRFSEVGIAGCDVNNTADLGRGGRQRAAGHFSARWGLLAATTRTQQMGAASDYHGYA